jgi:hypothetical protein
LDETKDHPAMSQPQTPEEILTNAWSRVAAVQPPVADAPGSKWHFALGALWALGCAGLLDEDATRRWEATAQAQAARLQGSPNTPGDPL